MAGRINVEVEGIDRGARVFGDAEARTLHLLRDAIDDIGDQIEAKAQEYAPVDKDPDAYSWRDRPGPELKEHPTDREDDKGRGAFAYEARITVAKNPHYAIFVHEGTGPKIAKPGGFMVYKSFGRWSKREIVAGQDPQPYLTEAYEYINNTYVRRRVEQLRNEIAGLRVTSLPKGIKSVSVGRFGTRYQGPGGRFIKAPR